MFSSDFQAEILRRSAKIQAGMRVVGADAALIHTNANLYYTSGRVFSGYTYIPVEGEPHYFVRRPVGLKGETVHYIRKPEQIPALLTELGLPQPRCVALEWDATHGDYMRLAALFPEAKVVNASAVMRGARAVKTEY